MKNPFKAVKESVVEGINKKKEKVYAYCDETRPARYGKVKNSLWYAIPALALVMFIRVAFFLPQPEVETSTRVQTTTVESVAPLQPVSSNKCDLEKSKIPSEIYRKCSVITEESSKYGISPAFLAAILVNKNQENEIPETKIRRIAKEVAGLYDQFNGDKVKVLEAYAPNNVQRILATYKSYK